MVYLSDFSSEKSTKFIENAGIFPKQISLLLIYYYTYIEAQNDVITINHTVDYMARGFMSFMRGVDITRAIGRVG